MSYQEVENLIERMTGQRALSDQWIWQGVIAKSVAVSQQNADEAQKILKTSGNRPLTINARLDLYDHETPEILLFEDGIQVKRQKDHRTSPNQEELPEDQISERKRVNTDVIILQKAKGDFEYLTTPLQKEGYNEPRQSGQAPFLSSCVPPVNRCV